MNKIKRAKQFIGNKGAQVCIVEESELMTDACVCIAI